MDEMVNEVVETAAEEVIPEVKVSVTASSESAGIQFPNRSTIGQSMVNTATGIVCGVVINGAVQGVVHVGKKIFCAGKKKFVELKEASKERKTLKEAEQQAQEQIAQEEASEE